MSRPPTSHVDAATWRMYRAVRKALAPFARAGAQQPLVLVGLSGGADSLALAASTAAVTPELGIQAGVIIIDHGLQDGSAEVAQRAAEQARSLDLDPINVRRVQVDAAADHTGLEAAARSARYRAFREVADESGAVAVLTAHTLDDVAESVLLGLARGSGARSLAAMREQRGIFLRPFLAVRRDETNALCRTLGLEPWHDPQNSDESMLRAAVRHTALPTLRNVLGAHIDVNLARSAVLLRDDADALETVALACVDNYADTIDNADHAPWAVSIAPVVAQPRAVRTRVYRILVYRAGGKWASLHQTQLIDELVTNWHGQGPIAASGAAVERSHGSLLFSPVTPVNSVS